MELTREQAQDEAFVQWRKEARTTLDSLAGGVGGFYVLRFLLFCFEVLLKSFSCLFKCYAFYVKGVCFLHLVKSVSERGRDVM